MSEFQKRLRANDREAMANAICYPLRVNGQTPILVEDRAQFIRQFDAIFTPDVARAVLAADARKVFCSYQGIMLGNGVVWARKDAQGRYGLCAINE